MAYPPYLKAKARELRRERQLTLDELVERLALPRTTIWYWIEDLPLTRLEPSPGQTAARRNGNLAMQRKYRTLRDAAYDEGRRSFAELSADPTFRDFVCLYIAEGYKRSRNRASLGNSDPIVIELATRHMRRHTARELTGSIQYHADQDPDALRWFWAQRTEIPRASISTYRKGNSGQLAGRTWRCRYGVFTVVVNDTLLRARLQAWMDCLRRGWLDSTPARGVAKPGIASALGAEERRFKSGRPD